MVKKSAKKTKAAKKPAAKKIVFAKLPWEDDWGDGPSTPFRGPRTLWDVSNDFQRQVNRIGNARDVVELVAEKIMTQPESGALWAAVDALSAAEEAIDRLAEEILSIEPKSKTITVKP